MFTTLVASTLKSLFESQIVAMLLQGVKQGQATGFGTDPAATGCIWPGSRERRSGGGACRGFRVPREVGDPDEGIYGRRQSIRLER